MNRRRVRMVFRLELRRSGDLLGTIDGTHATGPAGEPYVDYRIAVRNVGTDPVMARVAMRLPSEVTVVRVAPTQGRCAKPDATGRLECSLGWVATGYDRGAVVTVRVTYGCSTFDPIAPATIVASSVAGDLNRSNNRAFLDELDRDCPDPFDAMWPEYEPYPPDPEPAPEEEPPAEEDPPPPPGEDPLPPPEDPPPPPEDPPPPPEEPPPPPEEPPPPPEEPPPAP